MGEIENKEIENKEIIDFVLNSTKEEIFENVEDIHPADFLDALESYEGDPTAIVRRLPDAYVALLVEQADDDEKYDLYSLFPEARREHILSEMSSDELVDLLGIVDDEIREQIMQKLNKEDAAEVKELLRYGEETAGGIMATEFISIREGMTVSQTIEYLRQEAPNSETPYYIYVLDEAEKLRGVVSLRDLITTDSGEYIKNIMNEKVLSVPVDMDQEEVGLFFEKYGYMVVPVVDAEDVMLGIITADDIVGVITEEHTQDMYRMAGLDEDESVDSSVLDSIKSRLPWLLVNMATAIIASSMVRIFEGTLAQVVALATFMPIVAGMGGNAGAQSLTLIVRSIALGELSMENAKHVLIKELKVGFINGIVIGLLMAVLGYIFEGNFYFSLVIGLALFLNLLVASISGYFVPVTLKKLNIDPALASSIFVTTFTDTLGFFFFLGLATMMMAKLL
ncbi:MAG: magnesium transporter [Peptostreptococcaceae bacterium]|nr:magnesium transporter [Peptostreptococcaceae bacterium]